MVFQIISAAKGLCSGGLKSGNLSLGRQSGRHSQSAPAAGVILALHLRLSLPLNDGHGPASDHGLDLGRGPSGGHAQIGHGHHSSNPRSIARPRSEARPT
jgi:hypothetical protein